MNDRIFIKLLTAFLVEFRIANDLKAVQIDEWSDRFGDESMHVEKHRARMAYENEPEFRKLFGTRWED
jgi:hypothetical protein